MAIKVLYVIDTLKMGGAEQSVTQMACLRGADVSAVCQIYRGDDLSSRLTEHNIPLYRLGISKKYGWLTAIWRLRQVVKKNQPELLHATLFRSGVVTRLVGMLTGLPVVDSFVSAPYSKVRRQGMSASAYLKHQLVYWLDRLTACIPRAYIANSRAAAVANARALALVEDKVKVVYRGRDPQVFSQLSRALALEAKAKFCFSKEKVTLVCLGRLRAVKRVKDIIDAVMLSDCSAIELIIVGDGPERSKLEAQAAASGMTIRFLGMRQDVAPVLQGADVFVSASAFEGLPGAVVEAMMVGLPCVLSDIPMHTEFDQAGDCINFFEMGNVVDCQRALKQLLQLPVAEREQRGARLAKMARQHFTLEQMVAGHEAVYQAAMKR